MSNVGGTGGKIPPGNIPPSTPPLGGGEQAEQLKAAGGDAKTADADKMKNLMEKTAVKESAKKQELQKQGQKAEMTKADRPIGKAIAKKGADPNALVGKGAKDAGKAGAAAAGKEGMVAGKEGMAAGKEGMVVGKEGKGVVPGKAMGKEDKKAGELAGQQAGAAAAAAGQAGAVGPGGQPVAGTGEVAQTSSVAAKQEMIDLANNILDKMQVRDLKPGGSEVRMRIGENIPGLKGTEVILTRQKVDGKDVIDVKLSTPTQEMANYASQNQATLMKSMSEKMPDATVTVGVEQQKEAEEEGGKDRESQGEYVAEEGGDE